MNQRLYRLARRKILLTLCMGVFVIGIVLFLALLGLPLARVVQIAGIFLGIFVLLIFLFNEVWKGLCPKCGYDIRATPEHCAECGWKHRKV